MCVQLPRRSEKDIRSPETEVTDGWEQNSGLLEEPQGLQTSEPALQTSADVLNHFDFITISFINCAILRWLPVRPALVFCLLHLIFLYFPPLAFVGILTRTSF